jgi:uncharacterized membrane protein YidH (DUF202 family)
MNKAIGLAVLVGGIILLIYGIQGSQSFSSDVSRTFNGTPTNQSVWMIIGGVVMGIVGLVVTLRGGRGTRI